MPKIEDMIEKLENSPEGKANPQIVEILKALAEKPKKK